MSNGFSLHIGLNHVDPARYKGWSGQLAGCENDAHSMQAICMAQGFETSLLLTEQATADAVLSAIDALASRAASGDTVVISYSGHGGQVPDTTGTEDDGLCETWLCFDRMVVDKELYAKWSAFKDKVHVEVYSDSCHSGTVIRDLIVDLGPPSSLRDIAAARQAVAAVARAAGARNTAMPRRPKASTAPALIGAAAYRAVYAAQFGATDTIKDRTFERMIPANLAYRLFKEQAVLQNQPKPGPIRCGVTLLSGCQDNQTSADGQNNGLFTEKLLQVWDNGAFAGTIPQFHRAILALMPTDQTPGYDLAGVDDDILANGRPLTVLDAAEPAGIDPTITAPASADPAGAPPVFTLAIGAGRSGIVEVTTDPACFGDSSRRRSDNFYGSYSDGPWLHDGPWTLPASAWHALGGAAGRIYYRAGSTTDEATWADYRVSTLDSQAANAPAIQLTGNAAGSSGQGNASPAGGSAPRISAPQQWSRDSDQPPVLTVTTDAPFHVVEVATQASLFANADARTDDNFYGSWQGNAPLLTTAEFELPLDKWSRMRASDRLFYRTGSATSNAYDNYQVSTPDEDASQAPFVALTN